MISAWAVPNFSTSTLQHFSTSKELRLVNNLPRNVVEFLVDIEGGFAVCFAVYVAAVFFDGVRIHVIHEVIAQVVDRLVLEGLLLEKEERLNAAVKASAHGVG